MFSIYVTLSMNYLTQFISISHKHYSIFISYEDMPIMDLN